MIITNCAYCGKEVEKQTGHYNRAMKTGSRFYCDKKCAGLGRRDNKTIEQKKKEKAQYDKKYRYYHKEGIKEKKAEQFKIDYAANPEKYRKERKRRYAAHLKYLSSPEYKKWKEKYDKKYRAKKLYGEDYAEAALILTELEKLLPSKQIKYDYNITQNKSSQKRKRKWQSQQKLVNQL